jgi:hypothetical protein
MFCPQCKAEYRYGFTTCSDCGVDLVESLPDDDAAAAQLEGDPAEMIVLWAGVPDFTRLDIEKALDEAKIQYEEDRVESDFTRAFRRDISRIRVQRGALRDARHAIQNIEGGDFVAAQVEATSRSGTSSLLGLVGVYQGLVGPIAAPKIPEGNLKAPDEDPEQGAPVELAEDNSQAPAESESIENFHAANATAEIWSGEDAGMPENIKMCLSENGIGCAISSDGGKHRVMVLPADEVRAKEIVREIVEETPPQ